MAKTPILKVGKYSVGYDRITGGSLLLFEFHDREPICLLLSKDDATELAKNMLAQHANPPSKSHRPN